ncbi:MAG: translocation/assembly module TamB [Muribaculaceae bacterium]|nr:translocation/assembly module TamB [Muribaculaceae bacterium]
MSRAWKIFRFIAVTLLLVATGLPVGLYIALSTPWAQDQLCRVASEELSALLSTDVKIERVALHPFNRISVYGLSADDDFGNRAMGISEISAGFELRHFLTSGKMVIDYALVDGADINIYKLTPDAPLNIAGILDKLRSKDKSKPPTRFDLKINTVILRNARLRYDVRSIPGRKGFDPNHMSLTGLNLNAYIPRLSNDQYTVEIDRLNFREGKGFVLTDFRTRADVRSNGIDLSGLNVELPNSKIALAPVHLGFNRFEQIPDVISRTLTRIQILNGSNLYLPDLQAIVPVLADVPVHIDIDLLAEASLSEIKIHNLDITDRNGTAGVSMKGNAAHFADTIPVMFDIESLALHGNGMELTRLAAPLLHGKKIPDAIQRLPAFTLKASAEGSPEKGWIEAELATSADAIYICGDYSADNTFRHVAFNADVNVKNINLAQISGQKKLGMVSGALHAHGRVDNGRFTGNAELLCDRLGFNGYDYSGINATLNMDRENIAADISVDDPGVSLRFSGDCYYASKQKRLQATMALDNFDPHSLKLTDRYPGYSLKADISAEAAGSNIDDATGLLTIENISFDGPEKNLALECLQIELDREFDHSELTVNSDILNGQASGNISFSSLVPQISDMVSDVFPVLAGQKPYKNLPNRFNYEFTLSESGSITDFFNIPVKIISPVSISGTIDSNSRHADFSLDAPYLQQGDKIIENTALIARLDGNESEALVYGTTKMPTKKGPLALVFTLDGLQNRIDSHFDWMIERKIPINGKIDFSTLLSRNDDDQSLIVDVDFNRSDITFGNDVWEIKPSRLKYSAGKIAVDNFSLSAPSQTIAIDGIAGADSEDSLRVGLDNVELIEIFETLEIDKALIGGRASGVVTGNALLSKTPVIQTERLYVENIGYNRCTLGNAEVKAHFNNERQSFYLDADIEEPDGRHSHIYGDIFPATESLDISFDADRVRVGFMQPFMSAFASSIDGYASGHARLFGTFKYIDMEGDIYADSLQIKIDFTNTRYSASDSIRLRPGLIEVKNVTVKDPEGHTALLNGTVKHKFFKEPVFDFAVTDARNFLSYDVDSKLSPDWYGRVYGNGSAFINGWPGVVNISVSMTTAPRSRFTFVLSDQLIADEYSFITFRKKAGIEADTPERPDDVPREVHLARQKAAEQAEDSPSAYNMDIQVDITPDAAMTIVMDPVGGDEIKATGAGNLRLTYGSLNNDLRMYGVYTLENGSYNFTLQDIIIKDFTINQGSSIAFHGDPYNAQLDIRAVYQVNANLSDLDESFLQDKDLNRTNVPVQALMMVKGDMRQPDISFDLLFPTLNEDIYRKVHSIVSTDDMMNRQIIYLLALNRFYTPDYIASTTKGSEVFAVASSTISSQLSSMLGKLSDHWSIAPNLRSDRGDFSDVEVDVALSSRLLNNRLLFNGNFGYRDKSLNTNQFIGDFDIEYLLNRRGSWRLKAYNRYNDQNYYVRTAATTQGIGIMFRKDFDDFFKFLRPRHKAAEAAPADSIPATDGTQFQKNTEADE